MNAKILGITMPILLMALPSSTSYQLNSYGFGNGGTAGSSSANYSINGSTGEVAGSAASTNYKVGAGENYEKQANVPTIAIANNDNWYNKLLVTIGPENNPSDAKFAVAISSDGFATTQYVKNDFTITNTLTFSDYQTYAAWGSGAGEYVRGLAKGTVYSVKARAYRGIDTESAYGPVASVATSNSEVTFDIDVAPTDTSTSPPYVLDFGNLPVSTVTATSSRVWVSLDTNGESGGSVYLSGQNTGLTSAGLSYTIGALTGDLGSIPEGVGVQGVSVAQTSGGPLALVPPYDGTGNNVGTADSLIREIFSTSTPLLAGRGSFVLKAKTKPLTPASRDYAELLTAIASISF